MDKVLHKGKPRERGLGLRGIDPGPRARRAPLLATSTRLADPGLIDTSWGKCTASHAS